MNLHCLPLTFTVAKPQTLDTMEAVFATARRGGCQLKALQLRSRTHDDVVSLELQAPDPDLLALFLARLRNLVDVEEITRMYVA
ncbi:MAG: hypothetical protein V4508_27020 [Pseudomonadota bacterium]